MVEERPESDERETKSNESGAVYRTPWKGEISSLGTTTVLAGTEAEGCLPMNTPPLGNIVDSDALESLLKYSGWTTLNAADFHCAGYDVEIDRDGLVALRRGTTHP